MAKKKVIRKRKPARPEPRPLPIGGHGVAYDDVTPTRGLRAFAPAKRRRRRKKR